MAALAGLPMAPRSGRAHGALLSAWELGWHHRMRGDGVSSERIDRGVFVARADAADWAHFDWHDGRASGYVFLNRFPVPVRRRRGRLLAPGSRFLGPANEKGRARVAAPHGLADVD